MHERVALFQRLQPGCPFEIIEGAGHWVMYERPDRFNPLLLDILAR
jgi:pimeloyl-ACP methyl ester carboxylesterase